jgi:SM-20-related protein
MVQQQVLSDDDVDRLASDGYVVRDGFIGAGATVAMRRELDALWTQGAFRPARVGHRAERRQVAAVRSDRICWFLVDDRATDGHDHAAAGRNDRVDDDGVVPGPAVSHFVRALRSLADELAQACFLPLSQLELHAACYEPGTRYAAHLDTFHDDDRRLLSVCFYLNDEWQPDDGGLLRLHTAPETDIEPKADRLVIFRSASMLHEVLPVVRRRFSVTGWLGRRRA